MLYYLVINGHLLKHEQLVMLIINKSKVMGALSSKTEDIQQYQQQHVDTSITDSCYSRDVGRVTASQSNQVYDQLLKCVIVGPCKTGKTLLCSTLEHIGDAKPSDTKPSDHQRYIQTIGMDFFYRILQYSNKYIKLQVWDTSGNIIFRNCVYFGVKDSKFVMLCYDLNHDQTLIQWLNQDKMYLTLENKKIFLVCDNSTITINKCVDNVKQLQELVIKKFPSLNICDSFLFNFTNQQQVDTILHDILVSIQLSNAWLQC